MSNFDIKIIELIEERQTVLFEIEKVLFTKRYSLSQKHSDIFSIQSISMIYSIWEGFIQNSFKLYVDELNKDLLHIKDYKDEIMIHQFELSFQQLFDYPTATSKKAGFFNKLHSYYNLPNHQISRIISTESNVSFEMLNKILARYGLTVFPEYWDKYIHPKPNLKETMKSFLRYRNGIAHGGDITSEEKITQFVYDKYKNLVLDLMFEIADKMILGLKNKTYIKV